MRTNDLVKLRTLIAVLLLSCCATSTFAAEGSGADCTEIDLSFAPTAGPLTDREIAQLHEARQRAALNEFERCSRAQASAGQNEGGANGGGVGSGAGGGNGVAASGIAGTELPVSTPIESSDDQATNTEQDAETAEQSDSETLANNAPLQQNGRAPLDIPPADSDGALAAQIRAAAEAETDPERRDRLWNEYRKIKGLSTQ